MLECVPCTREHIDQLKPRMREADRRELTLSSGQSPESILDESFDFSRETYAWIESDVVLCVFGVADLPDNPEVGIPWLIASDEAVAAGKRLVRHCRDKIEILSKPYRCLFNAVHAENEVAIRWLRWCGFRFLSQIQHGPLNAPFLPFVKDCRDV